MITIDYNILQNGDAEYYVSSGSTAQYPIYYWYLNGNLVGNDATYIRINPQIGDKVYVKITNIIESCTSFEIDEDITECKLEGKIEDPLNRALWHNGHYYGGNFLGIFDGGTFHYGIKNGVEFSETQIKPKIFIK